MAADGCGPGVILSFPSLGFMLLEGQVSSMLAAQTLRPGWPLLALGSHLQRWGGRARAVLCHAAVILSLAQLLGITHALGDFFAAEADEKHCADRCPNEDESEDAECPPFCPTCSCAHASRPLIATPISSPVLALLEPRQLLDLPRSVWHYDSPPASAIFRPPRS